MRFKRYDIIFCWLIFSTATCGSLSAKNLLALTKSSNLFEFILPESKAQKSKVKMIKYNAKIYEFAYKVYLQAANTKDAYTLAIAAVLQNPTSKIWRERLAQVAIWQNEPLIALKQYVYLAVTFYDKLAIKQGLQLAKSMHEGEYFSSLLLLDMQNEGFSDKNWQEYVTTMLGLGNLEELITILNKYKNQISKKLYLDTLSTVYSINDDAQGQLAMLNNSIKYNPTSPKFTEQLAQLYINQRKIAKADQIINQASKNAKPQDKAFWDTYTQVSYLINKKKNELYGYQQLLKQKKPEASVYTRIIELLSNTNRDLAYKYALEGKKNYPDNYVLTNYTFSLIVNKNQSIDFPHLLATTPKSVIAVLKYDSVFWNTQALYWQTVGDKEKVMQVYLTGIKYAPSYDYLKSNLIYYLIEQNDQTNLQKFLSLWQERVKISPELWGAYVAGYTALNKPEQANLMLAYFYNQFLNYKENPLWLILFKDILESANHTKESIKINHYAWPVYLNYIDKQTTANDYQQILNYVKLAMQEAVGDPSAAALSMLQNFYNEDVELLILTWALKHNNFSLARAAYNFYHSLSIEPPFWAQLSIALERQDRALERKIIMNKKAIISYRDHIRASISIDAIPHAQTAAFKELKKNRHDQDLYDNFFIPVMLRTASSFDLSQEYYQYGNVVGPRNYIARTYFISPGISLTPYNLIWFTHNIPGKETTEVVNLPGNINQTLASVPAHDERIGIKIHTQQRRGKLELNLGYRTNLSSFFTAKLAGDYPIYNDLNTTAALGFQQPADDTAGLLVGGMKNNLNLGLSYTLFSKGTVFADLNQNSYFTQEGQYLANASQTVIRYEHKLWKAYPDWTLSPYGIATQYYNKTNRLLYGNILNLVPQGVVPNVNFLIPANSTEYGLTLSFGQNYIEDYTHSWRPLALFTLSQNSTVGPGKLFNLGAAGTILGRDHLLFYYEWGSNQGQGLQISRLIKVNYKIYM